MNPNLKSLLTRSRDYGLNYDRIFRRNGKPDKNTGVSDNREVQSPDDDKGDIDRPRADRGELKNVEKNEVKYITLEELDKMADDCCSMGVTDYEMFAEMVFQRMSELRGD